METRIKQVVLIAAAAILYSCNNSQSKNHGPIVLGDSSTIVTETDPDKLRDLVSDLQPVIKSAAVKDSIAAAKVAATEQKAADSAKNATASVTAQPEKQQQQPTQLAGNGLKADFGSFTVLIPNLNAKLASNANLTKASGAVYNFISGNIAASQLQVTAGVTKVSQRYQTVIVIKNELGTLPLETLSTTTSWEALRASGNSYKITGLEPKSLEHEDINRNTLRNAVRKAARRHRVSHRKAQEWEESVSDVRNATQKPLHVLLRSVMWKIDGKDANGKAFSKQVRVDMPL
jgi:hypothetical protein